VNCEARARTQVRRKAYADALRDRLEESLEMAVTDALTGLHNRRYVVSRLRQHLDALERSGEGFAVALIDIDHFKRINDSWGHQAGDLVLKGFAERLRKELRAIDIAGRYGGEEFLIVFSGATATDALEASERFRAAMAREPFVVSGTGDPHQRHGLRRRDGGRARAMMSKTSSRARMRRFMKPNRRAATRSSPGAAALPRG
jgi:two-component system cell cycle response regulator